MLWIIPDYDLRMDQTKHTKHVKYTIHRWHGLFGKYSEYLPEGACYPNLIRLAWSLCWVLKISNKSSMLSKKNNVSLTHCLFFSFFYFFVILFLFVFVFSFFCFFVFFFFCFFLFFFVYFVYIYLILYYLQII
jgi:hypothetical protein